MSIYSDAPNARPYSEDKPTLLVSWWITIFCIAIILTRLIGRYVRVEKLLREDKIISAALIPLILRAICVHFVLQYGTNNVNLDGLDLTQHDIERRTKGSRFVMASRVFYAAVLWIIKYTTLEFLSRLASATNRKSHALIILMMRWALGLTFLAVVVSNLAECQPFGHYWQVTPDPGGQCRQAFVHMLTMGICSVITDLVLVAFPIPIILSTSIATKRKVLLVMLFCLAFVTVVITIYRMRFIIHQHGRQVDRTMWASVEILAATAVGNTVALGSFLRDSGVKRSKFKKSTSYGYSGTQSQSQATRITRGVVSNWEEEERVPTTEGLWANKSYTPSGSMSKSEGVIKESSSHRASSPTQSFDSLIRRDHQHSSVDIPDRPPTAVVAGDPRELKRGNSVIIVGGRG